jgi:hypothetical protein
VFEQAYEHFFVVGFQRCGTTLLAELLDAHPEIDMIRPLRPEPKHFLSDDATVDPVAYRRRWFGSHPSQRVLGEKSTSYVEHPSVLDRIHEALPGARFLVLLRDPVLRAVSHYRFSRQNGYEDLPVDKALTEEAERRTWDPKATSVSPHAYLSRGRYVERLRPWLEATGDRTQVLVLEELIEGTGELDRAWRHLGVDVVAPTRSPLPRYNASEDVGDVPPGVWSMLTEAYEEPNRQLFELLGRPLGRWKG